MAARFTWVAFALPALIAAALTIALLAFVETGDAIRIGIAVAIAEVVVGIAIVRTRQGPIPLLSPFGIFAICHVAIFVVRPIYVLLYASSNNIFTETSYDGAYRQCLTIAGLGFIAASIGYAAFVHPRRADLATTVETLPQAQWRRLEPVLWAVVVIGLALYGLYVAQVGIADYWSSLLSGRSAQRDEALAASSGYLLSGLQFTLGALLIMLFEAMAARRWAKSALVSAALALALFPQVAAGDRSVFIPVVVAVLAYLYYSGAAIFTFRRVILWLPVLIVFGFVAPRVWRVQLAQGGSLLDALLSSFTPQNLFANFVGGLDTAMSDAFALQVAAQNDGQILPAYGSTYLSALVGVIPRALWPEKPETVDPYLNSILFPATHAQNIGFSFGIYSEPYLNFGLVGVVIVLGLVGAALALVSNLVHARTGLVSVFVVATVSGYLFPIVRGSVSFDSQRLLITDLPVAIAFVVAWGLGNRGGRSLEMPPGLERRSSFVPDRVPLGNAPAPQPERV